MRAKILMALTCLFGLLACEPKEENASRQLLRHCYRDTSHFEMFRDRLEQSDIYFESDDANNCVAIDAAHSEKADEIHKELFGVSPPCGSIGRGRKRNKELVDLLHDHGIETKTHYWFGDEYISWPPEDAEKVEELLGFKIGDEHCVENSGET